MYLLGEGGIFSSAQPMAIVIFGVKLFPVGVQVIFFSVYSAWGLQRMQPGLLLAAGVLCYFLIF